MAAIIEPPVLSTPKKNLNDSWTDCKECKGTGWIIDENNVATPCKCYKQRIVNNKIQFANIPEAFKDIRLSSFNINYYKNKDAINKVVKTVKYYIENFDEMIKDGLGLYMYSDTKGSGKTRMATSLANEFIYEKGLNVKFATSLDILNEIRATWDKESEFKGESQLIHYLQTVEILIIDDFGTEVHKEWIDDKFNQIVNTRYINKLVTIYTSNNRLDALDYDQRIISRIKEKVYQIHFPEESLRDGFAMARERQLDNYIRGNENG